MAHNPPPEPTRLESADEILKAVEARKARKQAQALPSKRPGGPPPLNAPPPPPEVPEAKRERPWQRPPMALLCVLDDGPLEGKLDGEWFRLRQERTLFGREAGDIRIPNDGQITGQEHAEIVRERTASGWRWLLRDLRSTNGTFVRIGSTLLRHDNEVLIGQGRYRFEVAGAPTEVYAPPETVGTLMPQPLASLRSSLPSFVEVGPSGPVQRVPLALAEYWIGRDPACAIVRADDPYCDPQHAKLHRDKSGAWHISNDGSLNGLWFRVKAMPLDRSCQFRLGEQRFLFRMV